MMNLPATVIFDVGIGPYPYLADHGFQGLVVLPGAFYIELALRLHIESLQATVGGIKRIEFKHPIILSEQNVAISVAVNWLDDQTVRYAFHETSRPGLAPAATPSCAVLEIDCAGRHPAKEREQPACRQHCCDAVHGSAPRPGQ